MERRATLAICVRLLGDKLQSEARARNLWRAGSRKTPGFWVLHAPQHINLCQLQAVDRLGNTVILAAVDEERATPQHAPESLEWLGWVPLDEHVTLHTDPGGHAGMVGGTPAAGQTEETHRERGARLHARVAPAPTKPVELGLYMYALGSQYDPVYVPTEQMRSKNQQFRANRYQIATYATNEPRVLILYPLGFLVSEYARAAPVGVREGTAQMVTPHVFIVVAMDRNACTPCKCHSQFAL